MRNVKYFGTEGEDAAKAMRRLAERMARDLAAEGKLTGDELTELAPLFPRWSRENEYAEGAVVRTEEGLFQLISQALGGKKPSDKSEGWSLLGGWT